MADSGIIVAIIAAIVSAITVCLNKCRFLYEHHPEGAYDLTIGFDRGVSDQPLGNGSNQSEISQHPHVD